MTDEIKGESNATIPLIRSSGTATFSYEESMAEFRKNMAEGERILKDSEKNVEAIDEWLNRQRQLLTQD
jgi:hypothetical protein